jgi:hypothetical protein
MEVSPFEVGDSSRSGVVGGWWWVAGEWWRVDGGGWWVVGGEWLVGAVQGSNVIAEATQIELQLKELAHVQCCNRVRSQR